MAVRAAGAARLSDTCAGPPRTVAATPAGCLVVLYLLGIPFDHGGCSHTRYFEMTQQEFENCMDDEHKPSTLVKDGSYLGKGKRYWSDFAPEQEQLDR